MKMKMKRLDPPIWRLAANKAYESSRVNITDRDKHLVIHHVRNIVDNIDFTESIYNAFWSAMNIETI